MGAFMSQYPVAGARDPEQGEKALKDAAERISVLALLGKEDKYFYSDVLKEKYEETFKSPEVLVWDEVGHLPCFEEPGKTRDAILAFVKRVSDMGHIAQGSPVL